MSLAGRGGSVNWRLAIITTRRRRGKGGVGGEHTLKERNREGPEMKVSPWAPISTRGTFYYEYTSSYVL